MIQDPMPDSLWRHVKTNNVYQVICCAMEEKQGGAYFVVYTRVGGLDITNWARPKDEFLDGRFKAETP